MPDTRALRDNLAAFAEAVGVPMTDWQARSLSLEARTTAICAPRQSGKSRALAVVALWWAYRRRDQVVLIVSAGEDASRRLLAGVRRIAAASPLLTGSVVDEQAALLTIANGSTIRSVPASERAIRGWAVDLLLVDEAALVPADLLLGAAIPTTAARADARIVLASSASVASGPFYDHVKLGETGSPGIRTERWSLADCTWIGPSVVAGMRESMSEARFNAEMMGVFASGADRLFPRWLIDRAATDYAQTALAELRGPARYGLGVDYGYSSDKTAVSVIGRVAVPGPAPLFGLACSHAWPSGFPNHEAIRGIAASGAPLAWVVSEKNGLGAPLTDDLFRVLERRRMELGGGRPEPSHVLMEEAADGTVRLVTPNALGELVTYKPRRRGTVGPPTVKIGAHTTQELKGAAYGGLRLMLERGELVLPLSAEPLLRELLLVSVEMTVGGGERIEASHGHDDLADSLALSLRPYRGRDGRWRVRLAELARVGGDHAERPPVPLRPSWRSVDGDAVTATEGDEPEAADNELVRAVLARVNGNTMEVANGD